jgi:hypothetical protein
MHQRFTANDAEEDGTTQTSPDSTAPEGTVFHHANDGRPLATPWQVATERSMALADRPLAEGYIVDPACGSGLQVWAHALTLARPAIGIELDPARALASALNLRTVGEMSGGVGLPWCEGSAVLAGNGLEAEQALATALGQASPCVAMLQLDPARPRNSRHHDLSEMRPALDDVLDAWRPWFAPHDLGPAMLLDLSPRLSADQRAQVETMVEERWPSLRRTWVWTSRGRGRVDRLALWTGPLADDGALRRFVRIPPKLGERPFTVATHHPVEPLTITVHPPQRGEHVSLLDAALVESGLVAQWLADVTKDTDLRWGVVDGRRPQLHHPHPLRLRPEDRGLVQATGRVVALFQGSLSDGTVQDVVELAIEHSFSSLKLRLATPPERQPAWQGALDRQLSGRAGDREGFLAQHPNGHTLLLCVDAVSNP